MKYNKKQIMLKAWQLIKLPNSKYNLSTALKIAWKESKTKNNNHVIDKIYKENIIVINKICWRYSTYYKIDNNDLISKCNELFIKIYNRYIYDKVPFKKFLYIELNNYLKKYCKKEILRKKREELIYYQTNTIETIKTKQIKELSKLSKEILNYCIEQNTKKEMSYQKVIYKDKVYKYPLKIKQITINSIIKYFKESYKNKEIQNAFNEIKYFLKEELI